MSVIGAVQTWIKTYTELEGDSQAKVWVDHLDPDPVNYAIVPMPGERIVKRFLSGATVREFPFAFQMMEHTADDATRLDNVAFGELFADWLRSQTLAKSLPTMDTGQTPIKVEAGSGMHVWEQGESSGVYQVICKLTYRQTS